MTHQPTHDPREAASALQAVGLPELSEAVALQTRVDRKYIVEPEIAAALIDAMPASAMALEIDRRREFEYETMYFDTADYALYRATAHRRRKRFKVRTRTYVDTAETMLEVKMRDARGRTAKERVPHPHEDRQTLTQAAEEFIDEVTKGEVDPESLLPALSTAFRRVTVLDAEAGYRVTFDSAVTAADQDGLAVSLGDSVLVETKTRRHRSATDRWLWEHQIRPTKISKFATSLAALRPELPANRWRRVLEKHFTEALRPEMPLPSTRAL